MYGSNTAIARSTEWKEKQHVSGLLGQNMRLPHVQQMCPIGKQLSTWVEEETKTTPITAQADWRPKVKGYRTDFAVCNLRGLHSEFIVYTSNS